MAITEERGELKAKFVQIATGIATEVATSSDGNGDIAGVTNMEVDESSETGAVNGDDDMPDSCELNLGELNAVKWDMLEHQLHLVQDTVDYYVEKRPEGVPFDSVRKVIKEIRRKVHRGMSPRLGVSMVFHHIDGLINEHQERTEKKMDTDTFNDDVLKHVVATISSIRKEVYASDYFKNDYNMAWIKQHVLPQLEFAPDDDNDSNPCFTINVAKLEDEMNEVVKDSKAQLKCADKEAEASAVDDAMAQINMLGRSVGYVGGPETFGDADISDSSADSCCCLPGVCNLCSKDSNSSFLTVDEYSEAYKAAQRRNEENILTRIIKKHDLGIILLPELLRQKAYHFILEGRKAIRNRGYTAKDAWSDLEDILGKLRPNTELRRIFTQATYASDLDG